MAQPCADGNQESLANILSFVLDWQKRIKIAHTGFDDSNSANGVTIAEPVSLLFQRQSSTRLRQKRPPRPKSSSTNQIGFK